MTFYTKGANFENTIDSEKMALKSKRLRIKIINIGVILLEKESSITHCLKEVLKLDEFLPWKAPD